MKKDSLNCIACPYKRGLIQTLFHPCKRCKEMYKMYGAVQCDKYDKTIYAFSKNYQKQK